MREGSVVEVGKAGFGGDRESWGHRQANVGHLGEVGALPAEQALHVPVALVEVVDELAPGCLRSHDETLRIPSVSSPV